MRHLLIPLLRLPLVSLVSFVVILPLLLLACSKPSASRPPVHFAREEVSVNVHPGSIEVLGNYHFTCSSTTPGTAQVLYPFPLDQFQGYPDSIALPGFEFERGDSGVSFRMKFQPQSEDSFLAYYRQPLRGTQARYIVTTTRKWGRAIDRAQFRVTVPASFQDVKLSYKPDSVEKTDSTVTYRFSRTNFYPDQDIIVTWR